MNNPLNGDATLIVGDKSFVFKFSVDAICLLEDATGKGIIAISTELQDSGKISMSLLRKIVWAGLQEHHPDIDLKQAGELIPAAGGMTKIMPMINIAFAKAFPETSGEPQARPRKPSHRPDVM